VLRAVLGGCLILVAAVAQTSLGPNLEVAGAYPNFVLLAVVAFAWVRGAREAMAWACAGGLLLDLMSPGPIGPHAVALVAVAYLTGFWTRNLGRQGAVYIALSAATGTAVYSAVVAGLDVPFGLPVPDLLTFGGLTLAACAYNSILMPPVAGLARMLGRLSPDPAEPA
jgi:rod shape-determining protein MreD